MPRVYFSPNRQVVLPEDYLAVKRMHDQRRIKMSGLEEAQIQDEKRKKQEVFPLLNYVEFRPPLYITDGGKYRSGIPEWRREVPWKVAKELEAAKANSPEQVPDPLDFNELARASARDNAEYDVPDDALQRRLKALSIENKTGGADSSFYATVDRVGRVNGPLRVSPAKVKILNQMQRLGRAHIPEESEEPPSLYKSQEDLQASRSEGTIRTGRYMDRSLDKSGFHGYHDEDLWGGIDAPSYQYVFGESETGINDRWFGRPGSQDREEADPADEEGADADQSPKLEDSMNDSQGWAVLDEESQLPDSIVEPQDDWSHLELTSTSQKFPGPPDASASVDRSLASAYGRVSDTPWKPLPSTFVSPVLRGSEAPSAFYSPDPPPSAPPATPPPPKEAQFIALANTSALLEADAALQTQARQLAQQTIFDVQAPPAVQTPPRPHSRQALTMDSPLLAHGVQGTPSSFYRRAGSALPATPMTPLAQLHSASPEEEVERFLHALAVPQDADAAAAGKAPAPPQKGAPSTEPPRVREARDVFWKKVAV